MDETKVDFIKNKPKLGSLALKDKTSLSDLSDDVVEKMDETKTELAEFTTKVAYINTIDNEIITDVEIGGSENIVVDSVLSITSSNPVQNKIITQEINALSEQITNILPSITAADAGKFLCVSSDGKWVLESRKNAEEVTY